jgi:hypothetical protein
MCVLFAGHSALAAGADKANPDKATTMAAAPSTDTKAPATTPQPAATTKDATPAASPALEAELEQLRQLLESQQAALKTQQEEIEALKTQLGGRGSNMASTIAPSSAAAASSGSTPEAAIAVAGTQYGGSDQNSDQKSPLSFKIGAANFTPGGFVDFTSYTRTTNVGSGIGTSFGSIPFNNASAGQGGQTESRFSAQNSRVSLKAEAAVGGGNITGYVETDFLGNAPSNLNVTSNSNTLRMRLYFADYRHGKWEMLAGQDWSMLTPNRVGEGVLPTDIFYSQDMDTNYQVGLVWARQAQFRLLYHPTDRWTMGLSFENPDQYTGSAVTFPECFSGTNKPCTSQANQVDQGTSTTSPAVFPDIVVKVARDQHIGDKNWHFELAGVTSQYRLFTPTSASMGGPGSSQSATGGGVSFNMNLEMFKNFHLIADTFWSDGEGRYIFGLGPNFIVNQNPTSLNYYPSLVHAGSGIGGFEWQFTKKSMFYGYYGGAYYGRTVGLDPLATGNPPIGYGFTGSSGTNNRAIQEGTLGVIQTFWKDPSYGALQLITQASYVTRAPWYVGVGDPKNAHTTMFYLDLRYVLP